MRAFCTPLICTPADPVNNLTSSIHKAVSAIQSHSLHCSLSKSVHTDNVTTTQQQAALLIAHCSPHKSTPAPPCKPAHLSAPAQPCTAYRLIHTSSAMYSLQTYPHQLCHVQPTHLSTPAQPCTVYRLIHTSSAMYNLHTYQHQLSHVQSTHLVVSIYALISEMLPITMLTLPCIYTTTQTASLFFK